MKRHLFLLFAILAILVSPAHGALSKANFAWGTLSSAIAIADIEDDTFTVTMGTNSGALPASGEFLITVFSASCSNPETCANREIIRIKSRSGTTLTIKTRDQESTTHTATWSTGANFVHSPTAAVDNDNYYQKTEIDTQGEVETIWGVTLATDTELADKADLLHAAAHADGGADAIAPDISQLLFTGWTAGSLLYYDGAAPAELTHVANCIVGYNASNSLVCSTTSTVLPAEVIKTASATLTTTEVFGTIISNYEETDDADLILTLPDLDSYPGANFVYHIATAMATNDTCLKAAADNAFTLGTTEGADNGCICNTAPTKYDKLTCYAATSGAGAITNVCVATQGTSWAIVADNTGDCPD